LESSKVKFHKFSSQILDILFTWTDSHPELGKVKEAYTMLRTQGVVHEPQKNVIKPTNKKSTDTTLKLMESEKFRRLLQSKNQKDIEAANLMIQNMVRDNDRRSQMQCKREIAVDSANENSLLLKEMLDELNPADVSEDTLSTLREIYNNCVKLKPTVMRLAEETHESESFTVKILETVELMNTVTELYTAIVVNKAPVVKKSQTSQNVSNLLDVSSSSAVKTTETSNGSFSELNDIFSTPAKKPAQIEVALLTPQVVPQNSDLESIMALINSHKAPTSDDLFGNFDLPSPQSPAKETAKEKPRAPLSEIDSIVTGMKSKLLSGPEEIEELVKPQNDSDDDVNNLISEELPVEVVAEVKQPEQKALALKDIRVDINDIEPSDTEPPRIIVDEKKGLKILVNFTNDKPAKDVMVLVITVINQGSMAISNFQFDASVSKPCKLRILEASGRDLPGIKPFKQPTETINQVLLLMNPTQNPVNMIAILTYNLEGDEDEMKESFEVKDIPFSS
jgi:ADP-ribosylation factor-binding protein GGA